MFIYENGSVNYGKSGILEEVIRRWQKPFVKETKSTVFNLTLSNKIYSKSFVIEGAVLC